MKTKVTYKDIISFNACYDPIEIGMPKTYSATIPEFIKEYRDKVQNREDIIWLLCRPEYMTDKDCRLFAVWCAREALKLDKNPDIRSVNACNVAEQFANGNATKEELSAAWDAAWDATSAAASAAAWDAARAASDAAWDAAWDAARDAAWAAAWAAARVAARAAQIDKLLTYF